MDECPLDPYGGSTDPFCAFLLSASANICNVVLMRHTELEEGIDVLDNNGNIVGSSRIAAKHVCTYRAPRSRKHMYAQGWLFRFHETLGCRNPAWMLSKAEEASQLL